MMKQQYLQESYLQEFCLFDSKILAAWSPYVEDDGNAHQRYICIYYEHCRHFRSMRVHQQFLLLMSLFAFRWFLKPAWNPYFISRRYSIRDFSKVFLCYFFSTWHDQKPLPQIMKEGWRQCLNFVSFYPYTSTGVFPPSEKGHASGSTSGFHWFSSLLHTSWPKISKNSLKTK